MAIATRTLVAGTLGYLAGTVPSADVASRLATRGELDLRTSGSGNPGATNAAQVLGKRWGAMVLAADVTKGAAAGLLGRSIAGPAGAYAAATAAVAGHIAPVWNGGRGGKGVATAAGACATVFPVSLPVQGVAAGAAKAAGHDAERAMRIYTAVWIAIAALWWRRRLPNPFGPHPTVGLPLFAAGSAAMMSAKVRAARRAE
jgi:glycerol-3-phosphate acyltransferase PlsY